MNPAAPDDRADLRALQQGEDAGLNRLIARWERPLFAFAWRYLQNTADARDVVADVFVRLYHHRHRLKADTNTSAWLFTTLSNLCHNQHRWRRRHPTVSLDAASQTSERNEVADEYLVSHGPGPQRALEKSETIAALSEAIDRLPHDLKVTLLLYHYEQLGYRAIGEITGCSERGVETRLYRAKQRLRAELSTVFSP